MEAVNHICKFARSCSQSGTSNCNKLCYPFVFLHGEDGTGGMWKTRNVPKKYDDCLVENLPTAEDSPKSYEAVKKYCNKLFEYVAEKGLGMYFFPVITNSNKQGTGNGKTTSAITVLNEYSLLRSRQHLKGEIKLVQNPAVFIKAADLQNTYNAQFRGSSEMQTGASSKYYTLKDSMKQVELLVIDDIALRSMTEAFMNELYEVIDARGTEERATIFTSNVPLDKLPEILGERIASRIEGMTIPIPFTGEDHRKGGMLK